MKKWILGIVLALTLCLTGCQSVQKEANTQDTWNRIARKKQVVIGLDDSFVPMGLKRKTAN